MRQQAELYGSFDHIGSDGSRTLHSARPERHGLSAVSFEYAEGKGVIPVFIVEDKVIDTEQPR
ncbi:hypothetical protein [Dyella amyloliquefaciens]|uniref:hypothetical protein n=1 Tax=Dyella amyloliquefaciens TaxID=1770545 RepID=UPI00102E4877|nr:hypothetical protein [Dyella amyloliquefaciens]